MANFETPESILSRQEHRGELAPAEKALHALIVPDYKKRSIQLDEFAGLYKDSVIANDKAFVDKGDRMTAAEDSPENRAGRMRGELFEAIVASQIADGDWMGPNADVIVPSRYDDMHNHVDSIVEFELEEGGNAHLALAIDVTESQLKMDEKLKDVQRSINNGELSQVKYFKSKNFRGELSGVPRIVLGAGRGMAENISELLLRFKRLQATVAESHKRAEATAADAHAAKEIARVREELIEHPLQGMILAEAKAQLEAFKRYAQAKNQDGVVSHYAQVLSLIDTVIKEKGKLADVSDFAKNDAVYRLLMDRVSHFGETPGEE